MPNYNRLTKGSVVLSLKRCKVFSCTVCNTQLRSKMKTGFSVSLSLGWGRKKNRRLCFTSWFTCCWLIWWIYTWSFCCWPAKGSWQRRLQPSVKGPGSQRCWEANPPFEANLAKRSEKSKCCWRCWLVHLYTEITEPHLSHYGPGFFCWWQSVLILAH